MCNSSNRRSGFMSFLRGLLRYKKSLTAAAITGGVIAAGVGGEEIVDVVINFIDVLDVDLQNSVD